MSSENNSQNPDSPNMIKAKAAVDIAQSGVMSSIFGALPYVLSSMARFFMFPAIFVGDFIRMGFAWHDLLRAKIKTKSMIAKTALETVMAIGVGIAIFGSMAAATVFAAATPILFFSLILMKTAYHLVLSIYHLVKALNDPEHWQHVRENFQAFVIFGALATVVAITMVFKVAALASIFSIVGAVVAGFNAVLIALNLRKKLKKTTAEPVASAVARVAVVDSPRLDSERRRLLGRNPVHSESDSETVVGSNASTVSALPATPEITGGNISADSLTRFSAVKVLEGNLINSMENAGDMAARKSFLSDFVNRQIARLDQQLKRSPLQSAPLLAKRDGLQLVKNLIANSELTLPSNVVVPTAYPHSMVKNVDELQSYFAATPKFANAFATLAKQGNGFQALFNAASYYEQRKGLIEQPAPLRHAARAA